MHPRRATELIEQGLTDTELAEAFGISPDTIYAWQKQHPEFLQAIKKAKEKPDREVEAALFKRAVGYEVTEMQGVLVVGHDGRQTIRVQKVIRKHIPGDTTCIIFWLKNRMPDRWRDVQRVAHSFDSNDGLEGITPEDEAEVAALVNQVLGGHAVATRVPGS